MLSSLVQLLFLLLPYDGITMNCSSCVSGPHGACASLLALQLGAATASVFRAVSITPVSTLASARIFHPDPYPAFLRGFVKCDGPNAALMACVVGDI
jgi:hypothetical protein